MVGVSYDLLFSLDSMLLWFIHIVSSWGCIYFHYHIVNAPWFIYSLSCWWKVQLFPVWGLSWSVLLWALLYIGFPGNLCKSLSEAHTLEWSCWYVSNCFSKVVVPIYTCSNNVWAFQLLYICSNTWHSQTSSDVSFTRSETQHWCVSHPCWEHPNQERYPYSSYKKVTSPRKPPPPSLVPSLCFLLP